MDFTEQLAALMEGNGGQRWLLAVLVAAGALVALRTLQALVRRRFVALASKTETRWDDYVVAAIGGTRSAFLLVLSLFLGTLVLDLTPTLETVAVRVLVIALLLQAGGWLNAVLRAIIDERRKRARETDPGAVSTISLLGFTARLALWSVVLLLILDNLGVDITALVAGLGIGGIAVALAVQNILGDLFASLSIVLDKPFVVGDFLMIGDFLGSVEHVGLKTTRLRSLSGEQLVFSNTDLLNSRIRNFGRMQERRVAFKLGVTYQTPRQRLEMIPGIIREAVEAQEKARFDRSHFMQYGDFSLNFETVYYVSGADYNLYMDVQQAIYLRIHERFEELGIQFAYPTQTLHLAGRELGSGSGESNEATGSSS